MKRIAAAGIAGVMLTVGAPAALAQSTPVGDAYRSPSGVVQTKISNTQPKAETQSSPAPEATVQQPSNSQLPFTGLDIGLVLAAGAMLLAAGFGIRRIIRPTGSV